MGMSNPIKEPWGFITDPFEWVGDFWKGAGDFMKPDMPRPPSAPTEKDSLATGKAIKGTQTTFHKPTTGMLGGKQNKKFGKSLGFSLQKGGRS